MAKSLLSTWVRILAPQSFTIRAPESPTTCVRAISAAIDSEWTFLGKRPVIGWARGRSARLRKRMRRYSGNSFQTIMRVAVEPHDSGANIICRTGMRRSALAFWLVWMAAACIFGVTYILAAWRQGELSPLTTIMPVVFPVFGLGLFLVCRYVAQDESDFIVKFIARTVHGEILPSDTR